MIEHTVGEPPRKTRFDDPYFEINWGPLPPRPKDPRDTVKDPDQTPAQNAHATHKAVHNTEI